MRFTRQGYRCRSCGFNFRFDLTSPVTECPECGSVINDKSAYYISRAIRGLGVAFAITMVLFIAVFLYMGDSSLKTQYFATQIAMVVFALLTAVFIFFQMWSLILLRIIYRGMLIIVVTMLLAMAVSWVLGALKVYTPDNTLVVAASLAIGTVLTLGSYLVFKLNRDTYDYVEDEARA